MNAPVIPALPRRRTLLARMPFIQEFGKFAAIGCLSLAIAFTIFNLSLDWLTHHGSTARAGLVMSNAIAFGITLSVAFFLNSRFTFRKSLSVGGYCKYVIVNVIGFALNTLLLVEFSVAMAGLRGESLEQMHSHFRTGERIAYLGAAGCTFIWNFLLSRYWVFRER